MKKIFVAATKQNDGKTTVALGLILNLKDRVKKVGYFKPIGQRYLEEEGNSVSKDTVLIEKVCKLKTKGLDTNPVVVKRGFTEKYIDNPRKTELTQKISEAFEKISKNKKIMIIEGTGHAGVGAVFDHSNAEVAKILGAQVIIVSSGGVGKPIDEIFLNYNFFESLGVKVLGAIINKVLFEKLEKVSYYVKKGLERKNIKVLGILPFYKELNIPTLEQILEETRYELIAGARFLNNKITNIIVGAMPTSDALNLLKNGSLVITPGDRDDIILAVISSVLSGIEISGLILTQGILPHFRILSFLKRARFPVILAKEDIFTVATRIKDITVKIRPKDKEKILLIKEMVKRYIDIRGIIGG